MATKNYRPTTPARRWHTGSAFEDITASKPEKSLTLPLRKTGGRNFTGRITAAHRGGGHRRRLRIIDFRRDKVDVPAKVLSIEYDPNRSARIALVEYADSERRYIIAPLGLKINNEIISSNSAEVKVGNALPLRNIPTGVFIHNLELVPGRGGQVARSAGNSVQIMAKEGDFAHVRLPSGEIRLFRLDCRATIGQVGNPDRAGISLGKAGRKRWLGRRPRTRGVAMNPVDHPLGGGEGKSSGGRHPTTPWGKSTKGLKTRKKHKSSDKHIVRRRTKKKKK